MKIQELAKELDMDVNVVLKKAQSMGYNVADKDSMLEGVDATAVKNMLIHAKDKTETKVVKSTHKKTEQKTDEPKVTVKAAKIPMPSHNKAQKAAPAKVQEKEPTRKPPVGKPVVNKDLENRHKPPVGKPVVSKELDERAKAKEAAAEAPKTEAPVKEAAPKAEAPKAEPAKEAAKPADGKPVRQQGLKILKKAADVREEERLAKEKREKAAAERAAEKKAEKADKADKKAGKENK